MKLFKVFQDVHNDYDTFDGFVCVAESEDDAKSMDPQGKPFEPSNRYGDWAYTIEDVQCQYLGEADPALERGVILSSFNAG